MNDQNFPITQDLVDLVDGVLNLLSADAVPLDVRVGSAMQDMLGFAFDRLEERIEIGLRTVEGDMDDDLPTASHPDFPAWAPILPPKQ